MRLPSNFSRVQNFRFSHRSAAAGDICVDACTRRRAPLRRDITLVIRCTGLMILFVLMNNISHSLDYGTRA
jgi:hypothetical protein